MGERVGELEEELERSVVNERLGRQVVKDYSLLSPLTDRMTREREQLELAYLDLQEKCRPFQVYTCTHTVVNLLL